MIFSGGRFRSSAMLRFQSMNTLFLIHNSFRLVAAFFVLFFGTLVLLFAFYTVTIAN